MSCDYVQLAAPGVQALQPYQPGKPEAEVKREYGLTEVIKLASNENPLGPSPRAVAAARDSLGELARYPDGAGFELKAALARHLDVGPERITLGNGSNDVLELIARAFLTPSDAALFSRHAFAVYPLVTQAIGAEPRSAPAHPADHPVMPCGHDLEAIRGMIDPKVKVVFIANPNNPTGTWLGAGDLVAFLERVPENVLVVVDEAYVEYADAPDYAPMLPQLGRFPNLIVTRTFSKAYGLAGLRVGYAVSHPQVADLLNRVRQPFNVNIPAQVAARAALEDRDYLTRSLTVNREGLVYLRQAFEGMGLSCLPSQGNFLCVRVGRPGGEVFEALLRRGVIVRPVGAYALPDYLRITVGTARENERLVEAMGAVLKG